MAKRNANMGEWHVSREPDDVLGARALGSCVAVCLYDSAVKTAAVAHVVLPAQAKARLDRPAMYMDAAVPLLIERIERAGAKASRLVAAIAGGAALFSVSMESQMAIGKRNAVMARETLGRWGVPIALDVTGGDAPRSIELHVGSGEAVVLAKGNSEVIARADLRFRPGART